MRWRSWRRENSQREEIMSGTARKRRATVLIFDDNDVPNRRVYLNIDHRGSAILSAGLLQSSSCEEEHVNGSTRNANIPQRTRQTTSASGVHRHIMTLNRRTQDQH